MLFGLGTLLFGKFVLPKIGDKIANQQYKLFNKFTGNKIARLIQTHYQSGAQIGLLLGGIVFICFGFLLLVGVLELK
jgi:hypothetical protein